MRARARQIASLLIVWGSVATLALSAAMIVGCGKYGKPLRHPPEKRERALSGAENPEKRYTLGLVIAASTASPAPSSR